MEYNSRMKKRTGPTAKLKLMDQSYLTIGAAKALMLLSLDRELCSSNSPLIETTHYTWCACCVASST